MLSPSSPSSFQPTSRQMKQSGLGWDWDVSRGMPSISPSLPAFLCRRRNLTCKEIIWYAPQLIPPGLIYWDVNYQSRCGGWVCAAFPGEPSLWSCVPVGWWGSPSCAPGRWDMCVGWFSLIELICLKNGDCRASPLHKDTMRMIQLTHRGLLENCKGRAYEM